jgi:DNA-binding NtrC family response regulator
MDLAHFIVGASDAIVRLRQEIAALGPTTISVLIEGETGTGKELIAQAIHGMSGRRGAFVPVNVAAVPDGLFESHLFGHRRGAFTGALTDHVGFFEEAQDGTLFLDEIGAMPPAGQAKLLRVLETRSVRPIGGRSDRQVNFRLVSAANVSLDEEVGATRFRADLMYRLCGDRIVVPPLRERPEDVESLAHHFCVLAAADAGRTTSLKTSAVTALRRHDWPGNVRQLRAVVERAVWLTRESYVDGTHVLAAIERIAPRRAPAAPVTEARELQYVLETNAWDIRRTAQELGVTRKTVYTRIQRLGIRIPGKFRRRGDGEELRVSESPSGDVRWDVPVVHAVAQDADGAA